VREVIAIIRDEGLIERSRDIAAFFVEGLEKVNSRTDRIKEVRSRGFMIGLELHDDQETSITTKVHRELVNRGFVLCRRPGFNVLRIDPALTIDQKEIEDFLKVLEDVLRNHVPD
jgi:4-aminobutyrate aminotransferase-like enzyme